MKRFAFKMYLKPGCEKEYEKRHAAIWPELVKMIKDGGVSNYSIYWDKDTNILFRYYPYSGGLSPRLITICILGENDSHYRTDSNSQKQTIIEKVS